MAGRTKKRSIDYSVSYSQPRLTPREAEMFALIKGEGITATQALASRLSIVPRVARDLKQRLRQKGFLSIADTPVGGSPDKADGKEVHRLRLHAIQLRIGVIGGVVLESRVIQDFLGCRVVIHPRMVEVYARDGVVFYGVSENEAQGLALGFFERLGRKLEHDLNCILIKPRSQNWEIVKAEWATEGSAVARKHIEENVPLQVFASEDGHRWLWGDWSKREPEHETGGSTGKLDSELVNRHVNAWRDNRHCPTLPELAAALASLAARQEETQGQLRDAAAGIHSLTKILELSIKGPQAPVEPEPPLKWRNDLYG